MKTIIEFAVEVEGMILACAVFGAALGWCMYCLYLVVVGVAK